MSEVNINDVVTPVVSVPEECGIFARRSGDFKARLQRYQQMEKAQDIRDLSELSGHNTASSFPFYT